MRPTLLVVVGGIVALAALAVAVVLGAGVAGVAGDQVAYLLSAIFAPAVLGLLSLLKVDQVNRKTDRIVGKVDELHDQVVNGNSRLPKEPR
jgi:hypothetical protein